MLCLAVYISVMLEYLRGTYPALAEQVASNMWIELLMDFTVGNLCTMFLFSIFVILFEVQHLSLAQLSGIAAGGGTYFQSGSICTISRLL